MKIIILFYFLITSSRAFCQEMNFYEPLIYDLAKYKKVTYFYITNKSEFEISDSIKNIRIYNCYDDRLKDTVFSAITLFAPKHRKDTLVFVLKNAVVTVHGGKRGIVLGKSYKYYLYYEVATKQYKIVRKESVIE